MNKKVRILIAFAGLIMGIFLMLRPKPKEKYFPPMGYYCITFVDALGGETPCIPQEIGSPVITPPKGSVGWIYGCLHSTASDKCEITPPKSEAQ